MALGRWRKRVGRLVQLLVRGGLRVMGIAECEEGWVRKIGLAVAALTVEGLVVIGVVGVHVWS